MGEMRNAYKILVKKHDGRRPFGILHDMQGSRNTVQLPAKLHTSTNS